MSLKNTLKRITALWIVLLCISFKHNAAFAKGLQCHQIFSMERQKKKSEIVVGDSPYIEAVKKQQQLYLEVVNDQLFLAMIQNPEHYKESRYFSALFNSISLIPQAVVENLGSKIRTIEGFVINPNEQTIEFHGRFNWHEPFKINVSFDTFFAFEKDSLGNKKSRLLDLWVESLTHFPKDYETFLLKNAANLDRKHYIEYIKFKLSQLDWSNYLSVSSARKSNTSVLYHYTKNLKTKKSILKKGFIPTEGMAGTGVYAVQPHRLQALKTWMQDNSWLQEKDSSSVLLKISISPDSRVINLTDKNLQNYYLNQLSSITQSLELNPQLTSKEKDQISQLNKSKVFGISMEGFLPELFSADVIIYDWFEKNAVMIINKEVILNVEGTH